MKTRLMTPGRWVGLVVLLGMALFAWYGGSYSRAGYRELLAREASVSARVDTLEREVDSLRALRDSLQFSPAVQERYAREKWGMVRDGELSFRITVRSDTLKRP